MRRRAGTSKLSGVKARTALTQLLYGCTAERLASFTAASLSASWNVSVETAEQMLAGARKARGV